MARGRGRRGADRGLGPEGRYQGNAHRVVTLGVEGQRLAPLGRSPELGSNDGIFSVRFADHRAYVVASSVRSSEATGLVIVDLAEPRSSQLAGGSSNRMPASARCCRPTSSACSVSRVITRQVDPESVAALEREPAQVATLLEQCARVRRGPSVERGSIRENSVFAIGAPSVAVFALDPLDSAPLRQVELR